MTNPEIRKPHSLRFSDSEWRQIKRMSKAAGFASNGEYCRQVLLKIIPPETHKSAKNDDENHVQGAQPGTKNPPSHIEKLTAACVLETNMLLRRYVKDYAEEGEELAQTTREDLEKVLRQHGIVNESPDEIEPTED